ncbi:CLAVATA3/ESR-RELATED 11 [Artemisia annua]|uniref:CLAVATA3/ESR-RELATED 11 n=1 Tax=Artemisia annua TaxID=35608 RepID=A0A2U1LRB3_ARTAN|nr:CLAVATA3/ESR-RELATED 11 [Artemisia annua]
MVLVIPQLCGHGQPFAYVARKFVGRGNNTSDQQRPRVVKNGNFLKQVKLLQTDSKIKLVVESPNEETITLSIFILYHEFATTSVVVHCHLSNNRKMLSSKFDFNPFLNHHHHHHDHYENGLEVSGTSNAIDPHYGVEKRLVPSGPNPLHH